MSASLPQQVRNFIQRHALIRPGDQVLVAVSGGADSVALLHVLKELASSFNLRLTVAHLNHQIRGKDAGADARFVRQLARRWQLGFVGGNAAVPSLARRSGVSLEMAGRKARYSFFEKTALKSGCDVVATAHTADDNAETILLMLLRGCGAQGLAGIAPVGKTGKITVVRPLLETNRKAIEKYLRELKIGWREDLSNRDPAFMRNRVRHELLPLLEEKYNKSIKETLNRMSGVLREENDFMERFAEKVYSEVCTDSLMDRKATLILDSRFPPSRSLLRRAKEGHGNDRLGTCVCHSRLDRESRIRPGRLDLNGRELAKYHIAVRRRVLRRWLLANNVNSATVDFQLINKIDNLIMSPGKGGAINLAGGLRVRRRDECLAIEKQPVDFIHNTINNASYRPSCHSERSEASLPQSSILRRSIRYAQDDSAMFNRKYRVKINIPGITVLPGTGLRVKAEIRPGVHRERATFGKYPARVSVSSRKWRRRGIWARNWLPGDRMRPYGLDGSKKVQDIFSDAKVPVALRHSLPIFECGKEIIWIPGYRIAKGWEVKDPSGNALQLMVGRH